MDINELLNDKGKKPKERTEILAQYLLSDKNAASALIAFAQKAKDPAKATCIEAMEYATKQNPSVATADMLEFATKSLTEKAPRIKWESAKVIGNIAHLFPARLDKAIGHLLENSEHSGTVVRWSAAFALGEIVKLNNASAKKIIPAVEAACEREEKASIQKIYRAALKKVKP